MTLLRAATISPTWNVCLGILNKKDIIKRLLYEHKIDVFCLQETEIPPDVPNSILTVPNFNIEIENNNIKSRTAIYINENITYKRMKTLEGVNNGVIVLDLETVNKYRIVNLYRTFAPTNGLSQAQSFINQLCILDYLIKDLVSIS